MPIIPFICIHCNKEIKPKYDNLQDLIFCSDDPENELYYHVACSGRCKNKMIEHDQYNIYG